MLTRRTLLGLTILLAVALMGCGSDSDSPTTEPAATDDYAVLDFDAVYGGLTMSDEAPAFDDAYLLQDLVQENAEEYEDDLCNDPEVRRLERMVDEGGDLHDPTLPRFTFLRLLWGNLDAEITDDGRVEDGDAVDWSGQLHIDRGVVMVRRVVFFERPADSIVRPRIDRQTVSWFSHTGGHYDGLVVQIIEPPLDADGDGEIDEGMDTPNLLTIETMAYSETFDLADLAEYDEIVEVEPEGNAIHITGFTLGDLDAGPRGFMSGRWRLDPESGDGTGMFRGRWMNLMGSIRGHIMGRYGVNAEGEQVFFGKYIDRNGQFAGLLGGTWAATEEPGHGEFHGHWTNDGQAIEGHLGGRYLDLPERNGGFFQGRWATVDDDEAVESINR